MRGGYAWSSFMLGAEGRYSFRSGSAEDYIQYLRLDLNAEGDLSPRVGFIAEAGAAYIVDGDVRFPFSLLLSAGLSENVSMEASGGYYHSLGDYAALLSSYPFLRIPEEPLAAEEGWEGDLSLRLRLGHDLYLRLGSSLTAGTRYRAGDVPEPRFEPSSGGGKGCPGAGSPGETWSFLWEKPFSAVFPRVCDMITRSPAWRLLMSGWVWRVKA